MLYIVEMTEITAVRKERGREDWDRQDKTSRKWKTLFISFLRLRAKLKRKYATNILAAHTTQNNPCKTVRRY